MPLDIITYELLTRISQKSFDEINAVFSENNQRPIPNIQRLARLRGKGTQILVAIYKNRITGFSFLAFVRRGEGTVAEIFDTLLHPAYALPWEEDKRPTPPWEEMYERLITGWNDVIRDRKILSEVRIIEATDSHMKFPRRAVFKKRGFVHEGGRFWVKLPVIAQ